GATDADEAAETEDDGPLVLLGDTDAGQAEGDQAQHREAAEDQKRNGHGSTPAGDFLSLPSAGVIRPASPLLGACRCRQPVRGLLGGSLPGSMAKARGWG